MRPLLLLTALLLTAACSNTPAPGTPAPGIPDGPHAPGAAAPCPAPTDSCMNEDNHAQCMEIAATCDGEILQLESCPLQFSCSTNAGSTGGNPHQSVSPDDTYQPCAGKSCGDECSLCAPGDADCVETAVIKVCDQNGTCGMQAPKCE